MTEVRISAAPNIALIKYWGKRHKALNLPLTSSFSVTLSQMRSWATVREASGKADEWNLMGDPSKAQRVVEAARQTTGDRRPLYVSIENNFPSGAGLASSASSMAALTRALSRFLADDTVPMNQLTTWSRLGSGSSVRSLFPGYVHWEAGTDPEGKDCIAETRFEAMHLPLALVACVVDDQPKPIGSTAAMERSRDTSPLYEEFHTKNTSMMKIALDAVTRRDFIALGEVSEANCLLMHEVMQTSGPPINYFKPGTHAAIDHTRKLRAEGIPCFFTIDAGPNVKIFCPPEYQESVRRACENIPGVKRLLLDRIATQLDPVEAA